MSTTVLESPSGGRDYRFPAWSLALLAVIAIALGAAYSRAIVYMFDQWSVEENSHGYLMPLIAGYLLWQRRATLRQMEFTGSWFGCGLVIFGMALDAAARLAALYVVEHVALMLTIAGLVLAMTGWRVLRVLGAPLGVLCFMIPVPTLLINVLSDQLQLLSSNIAVWMMRAIGVTVFLEGNVIDLGGYKLEVAQACSGLRYLLPLLILAFLMACFYRAALWKRALLVLSSLPITVIMNSLRVAAIGVMVDHWGPAMAEGLIHEVQGWMMFMMSAAVLLLEVMLISRFSGERRGLQELFTLQEPLPVPANARRQPRGLSLPLLASGAVVAAFGVLALAAPAAANVVPARLNFDAFPMSIGRWSGQRASLEPVYLDALKLDDYLLADFTAGGASPVNLYVAWYDAQRPGDSTHSPKACLPGGGWHIQDLRPVPVSKVLIGGVPLVVNRVLIQYEDQRELVYYWFQQRGRVLDSEYAVKWYLLVDSATRHRTDGALVRLIAPITTGMTEQDADASLRQFVGQIAPSLDRYIPH